MSAPQYPSPRFTNRVVGFSTQLITLAATTTLVWNDPGSNEVTLTGRQLYCTASGAPRILVLPSINVSTNARGVELVVAAISNAVTVKTSGSAATVAVIPAGNSALITMYSNTVYSVNMGSGTANFGAAGILANVIAESTAAAGVTIDGLLLKDGFVVALDNQGLKLGTGVDDTIAHNGTNTSWVHTTGDLKWDQQDAAGAYVFDLGSDTANSAFRVRDNSLLDRLTVTGIGTVATYATLSGTGAGLTAGATMSHATQNGDGLAVTIAQITTPRASGTLAGVRSTVTSLAGSTAGTDVYAFYGAAGVGEATVDHFAFGHGAGFDYSFDFNAAASGEAGAYLPANKASAYRYADSTGTLLALVTTTGALSVDLPDNVKLRLGTGADDALGHDGTNTLWTHTTGDLVTDNTSVTGKTIERLGTDTSATSWQVRNDSSIAMLSVGGDGTVRAGAGMWAGAPSEASHEMKAHVFFDDFYVGEFVATRWIVTEDDVADTQAVGSVQHGVVTLTCKAATDNDACQIAWAVRTFKVTAGKKLWFETRVRCPAGATENDFFVGITEAEDLTGVADNMPANGIGFHKDDGSTTIKASSSDGGVDTQNANVGTLVANTWIKLGFAFDGATTVTPYVDGVAQTGITVTFATMNMLSCMVMVRNGDGVTTQAIDVDYFKVVTER